MPIPLPEDPEVPHVVTGAGPEEAPLGGRFPSLCVHCLDEGEVSTSIESFPGFRSDLSVWDFSCETCSHTSKQVQFVGQYDPRGVTCRLEVGGAADLDRMLIKSENATISIPELEFEILGSNTPCLGLTRGDVSSVRDVLLTSITNLQMNQHERAPETAEAIESFLTELQKLTEGQQPFTLVMDDPSGNSYIETTGDGDAALTVEQYERSVRQALAIGLPVQAELEENTLESVAEEDELDD
ncbi:hypothetical protein ACKKBG_A20640 [Auxenochlorella protothecoides x Auxenochlorella symbiontica]